ncbi:MAG TPA: type II secretion system F family protein [Planctomycetaceae bacterium]|nr:type II secretion system F family protein [Planctomycetaceae bacterium]
MWIDIITVAAFLATFTTALTLGLTAVRARQRVRNIADVSERVQVPRPGAVRRSLAGAIPLFRGEVDAIEQDLRRAGFYGSSALVEFLFARNVVTLGTLLFGGTAAVIADPATSLPQILLNSTLIAAAVCYLLPRLILRGQANRRLSRIERGLPDALDIIRMCLTGGLPLRDSLERVARDVEFFHPDIAVEFEVVRRHAEADTMQKALKEFARRMNAQDVNALSSLVSQTERTGTHVATAVTEFADSMRRQYRQRAEERAGKTSIKMLFPVLLCLAPPVFILLVGPPLLQLRNFIRDAHQPGGVLDAESITSQQDSLGGVRLNRAYLNQPER